MEDPDFQLIRLARGAAPAAISSLHLESRFCFASVLRLLSVEAIAVRMWSVVPYF